MEQTPGEKQYGLIIPSKNKGVRSAFFGGSSSQPKPKVFSTADSSSSDENLEEDESKQVLDWRSRTAAKATEKSMQRNQARQAAIKALAEDPTVFQYDEVYDDMQQKKEEKKPVKVEKKPKYIANLMKTAELRKVEMERRTERKVQKERETEGDMFNDKEAFVTPAYREKLAELKRLEEEERLRELREGNMDVTKQADMSGFYRHLYNQTFAEPPKNSDDPNEGEKNKKEEPVKFKKEEMKSRQYRARREEEEEEEEETSKPIEPEPQVESETEEPAAKPKKPQDERPAASAALVSAAATDRAAAADRAEKTAAAPKKPLAIEPEESDSSSSSDDDDGQKTPPPPPKVKIDIWKKRTEGELLDDAIQRYQQRKEAREQGLFAWP
uniref:EOG090X0D2W n=1 Tax=Alona affinis TaxID=381656 RepID=A0A9N6ZEZ2_9CRUS|nr:EOG090X0D2W [Alona affinis]